jgi:hypothetical protein
MMESKQGSLRWSCFEPCPDSHHSDPSSAPPIGSRRVGALQHVTDESLPVFPCLVSRSTGGSGGHSRREAVNETIRSMALSGEPVGALS